jgi:hypothetical protein
MSVIKDFKTILDKKQPLYMAPNVNLTMNMNDFKQDVSEAITSMKEHNEVCMTWHWKKEELHSLSSRDYELQVGDFTAKKMVKTVLPTKWVLGWVTIEDDGSYVKRGAILTNEVWSRIGGSTLPSPLAMLFGEEGTFFYTGVTFVKHRRLSDDDVSCVKNIKGWVNVIHK